MSDIEQLQQRAQVIVWRLAAASTGAVLRYRSQILILLPVVQIAAGGAVAYFLGRWVGELLLTHWL